MENSIYTGLSRQIALQANMDIIANNIANMSTPGYRTQNMVFSEYVSAKTASKTEEKEKLSMVLDYGHYQNTAAGTIKRTGNVFDVAIQGKGFFGVQTNEGVMYTRHGGFQRGVTGELQTATGHLVAGEGGGAVIIPQEAKEVVIAEDGTVSTDQGAVGRIMVAEFENDQQLEAMGNGFYKAPDGAAQPATDSRVMQGMLEGSNVMPVVEMTRMIDVSRAYQSVQRMLQSEHERQRTMIQRLSSAT